MFLFVFYAIHDEGFNIFAEFQLLNAKLGEIVTDIRHVEALQREEHHHGSLLHMAKTMGWGDAIFVVTLMMTAIGLMLMVFSFVNGFRDNSIEKREAATEKFNSEYVCPNPKCHHFMGAQSYHIIRQNKNCPWCKCKFTTSK